MDRARLPAVRGVARVLPSKALIPGAERQPPAGARPPTARWTASRATARRVQASGHRMVWQGVQIS
ncbi:hypothetical protein [Streptomyces sp. NPDC005374]|uniref:hypothetical protein n=1 Tax=Streptomyces sp. NPDC005374 TaxID=3364713 RepID=UPI0036C7EA8F